MLILLKKNIRSNPSALSDTLESVSNCRLTGACSRPYICLCSSLHYISCSSSKSDNDIESTCLAFINSSELLYVKTLISPYGIKYAICYGCPDTFMVFHCFIPSLYGPCVPRSIFGGGGGLIDAESAGSQCSDFTPSCWLTRHHGLYLVRPGGRR